MPNRLTAALLFLALSAASLGGAAAAEPTEAEIGSVEVYLTPDQAFAEVFDTVTAIDTVTAVLDAGEMDRLREGLGSPALNDTVTAYVVFGKDGEPSGYAMIVDEMGKYRPFTFLVGTDPEFAVRNVEVLVYRESRGGEVRRSRFLRQYRGKRPDDAIRTNRDILNIAGATISVNGMNRGVKRALLTLEILAARNAL